MDFISKISGKNLSRLTAAAFFVLLSISAGALTTGEREIAQFEREALRCAREVFKQSGQNSGNFYSVELNNQMIRETLVKRATITFSGLDQRDLERFSAGDFDFSLLQQIGGIEVDAFIEAGAVKDLIRREINRMAAGRRIFDGITLVFANDKVSVSGKIDMQKVPGNPLAFMPQEMSPFTVTVSVRADGSQLLLEIIEGEMNGQPFTPELNKMFLEWLNPLWDFSALPYQASLDFLQFSPAGIKFRGRLFW
ncbi:MAG: hypothetical protein ACD_39C00814G0003 [uncultured bacterium]|nr:MAG: hypothetical protein ACD_39C00814G0003 [uncultured bacterium]